MVNKQDVKTNIFLLQKVSKNQKPKLLAVTNIKNVL